MAQRGVPVSAAAAALGHDPAVFLRTYAYLYPSHVRAVADAMDLARPGSFRDDASNRSTPTVLVSVADMLVVSTVHSAQCRLCSLCSLCSLARGENAGTNRSAEEAFGFPTLSPGIFVEAMGLEPTNLLTARPVSVVRFGEVQLGSRWSCLKSFVRQLGLIGPR